MRSRITRTFFFILLLLSWNSFYPQKVKPEWKLGFNYGIGHEIKNSDYTFTNQYYKVQLYYLIKRSKHFEFELLLQPELNFATHQLLNFYFVTPDEPNYEAKRAEFTKLKNIRDCVLGIGFLIRKPLSKCFSIYALGSVGPLITDTQTERLSKGFAFSDVVSLGLSLKTNPITFDIRPSIRHTSNLGFQSSNAGFNTYNIEFGFSFPL